VVDESHVTIPQIGGMYEGDRSRKQTLVDFGFRLPSALDNRPLRFEEFETLTGPTLYVSATPAEYELRKSRGVIVEQIIRPTGLIDPEIVIKPVENQVDDLLSEIRARVEKKERVLVTTLTKRMAEDLTDYLGEMGVKVRYLHSDIDALQRVDILRGLRLAEFDVLVGINLLREGLDLPEVSLVAILDADKEGFLRSERSLIQTAGRAARNVNGRVILYADTDDRFDAARARRDHAPPDQAARVQPGARHHATHRAEEHGGRDAHDLGGGRERRECGRRRAGSARGGRRARDRSAARRLEDEMTGGGEEARVRARRIAARPHRGSAHGARERGAHGPHARRGRNRPGARRRYGDGARWPASHRRACRAAAPRVGDAAPDAPVDAGPRPPIGRAIGAARSARPPRAGAAHRMTVSRREFAVTAACVAAFLVFPGSRHYPGALLVSFVPRAVLAGLVAGLAATGGVRPAIACAAAGAVLGGLVLLPLLAGEFPWLWLIAGMTTAMGAAASSRWARAQTSRPLAAALALAAVTGCHVWTLGLAGGPYAASLLERERVYARPVEPERYAFRRRDLSQNGGAHEAGRAVLRRFPAGLARGLPLRRLHPQRVELPRARPVLPVALPAGLDRSRPAGVVHGVHRAGGDRRLVPRRHVRGRRDRAARADRRALVLRVLRPGVALLVQLRRGVGGRRRGAGARSSCCGAAGWRARSRWWPRSRSGSWRSCSSRPGSWHGVSRAASVAARSGSAWRWSDR
jgi:hypothetical protein